MVKQNAFLARTYEKLPNSFRVVMDEKYHIIGFKENLDYEKPTKGTIIMYADKEKLPTFDDLCNHINKLLSSSSVYLGE